MSGSAHNTPSSDAVALAERAAAAFRDGRAEEARAGFAEALDRGPTDLRVLFLAFQFHFRAGEYDAAEAMVRRRIDVIGPDVESADAGRAWCNLGLVFHHRGQFDDAEAMMARAIGIDRRIGCEYGVARDVGNLGLVFESRNDHDRAVELYHESLEIAERIGADDIAAGKWANMGDIAHARGRMDEARRLWTRAVELFAKVGDEKHRTEFVGKITALDSRGDQAGASGAPNLAR
ncbi:MAG TPA: tetratricopeptide repeat protein [Phycisphaerales bacterium]|nr:tetratricopeptide repeat protein [Phycisphaerales bacterium]